MPSRPGSRFGGSSGPLALIALVALMVLGQCAGAPARAAAQEASLRLVLERGPLFTLPPPPIEELGVTGRDAGQGLIALRLGHVRERRREGGALLTLGLLGVVGGGLVAIVGRDDARLLSFGLTTLSFGAINVPLGVGLLDVRQRARHELLELTAAPSEVIADRIRAWTAGERGKRVSFAVNAGLDVVYVLVGALLIGLAERTNHPGSASGAGWAMVTQGAALLAYDLYGVRATTRRLRQLQGDAWLEEQLLY